MIATYLDVRNSAVSQIRAAFSSDRRMVVEPHPGSFNEAELRRLAMRTPAVLTSLLRIVDSDEQDESYCDFVSWILYRADNQDRLYDGSLAIVSKLIPVIRGLDDDWAHGGGSDIKAECLYSGALDKINVTLWAVGWKWKTRGSSLIEDSGGILLPDDLDFFEGYEADHQVEQQLVQDSVTF